MKNAIALCLVAAAGLAYADAFSDSTAAGQQFGQSMSGYVQGIASGTDSRASQYGGTSTMSANISPCNSANSGGQTTCGGQAENSAQDPSQYYSMDATALSNQATMTATTDPTAQYFEQAHNTRPDMKIGPQDPLFNNWNQNTTNMTGLAQTYQGCTNIAYGGTTSNMSGGVNYCEAYGTALTQEYTCGVTVNPYCADGKQFSPGHDVTIYANVNATAGGGSGSDGTFDGVWTFDVTKGTIWTSQQRAGYGFGSSYSGPTLTLAQICAPGVTVSYSGTVNSQPTYSSVWQYPDCSQNGQGEVWAHLQWRNHSWSTTITFTFHNVDAVLSCDMRYPQTNTCSTTLGTKVSTQCSQSGAKIVNGFTIPSQCWAWTDTYMNEVATTWTPSQQCTSLINMGCAFKTSTCQSTDPSGICTQEQRQYICQSGTNTQTLSVCGTDLVCPGGQCDSNLAPAAQGQTSFLQAATVLAMMQDMKNNFDPNSVQIWQGTYAQCGNTETLIGSNECCTGGTGFINQLPGVTCDTNEKNIQSAKQAKRVTQIGSYNTCVSKVAGVCVKSETYYQFCLWPSELARIVQDQGMAQLGQAITSACSGFKLQSPDQLAELNWSKIDLSEYFSNVMAQQATVLQPNGTALQTQTQSQAAAMNQAYQQQMNQYYGQ